MAIRGRRNRRFVVEDATVEYRRHSTLPFLGGSPKVSPLVNLAVGGLQFVSEHLYEPGQRLDLKVMIPSAFRSLSLRGEVVWARRVIGRDCYRTGVRYLEPSAEDISLLRSLEEQYWSISDERKQQLDAVVTGRYPLHHTKPRSGAARRAAETSGAEPTPDAAAKPAERPAAPTGPQAQDAAPAPEEAEEPPAAEAASAETPEPPRLPAEATPLARPIRALHIPVYDFIAGVEGKKDGEGHVPKGVPKTHMVLPDVTDPDCFALVVADDIMSQRGAPSFRRGDVVVFSPAVSARSGDLAFVVTRDGGLFRQVFLDPGNVVRLRPLNAWHAEQSFPRGEVSGIWKLIGKYESYAS